MRVYDERLTAHFLASQHDIATNGISFEGQVALLTGAGRGSICIELGIALLQGGATVIVTTWNRTEQMLYYDLEMLRSTYEQNGSKGSRLIAVPCNCTSSGDIEDVIKYVTWVLMRSFEDLFCDRYVPGSHTSLAHTLFSCVCRAQRQSTCF